jgi:hypothetical protein
MYKHVPNKIKTVPSTIPARDNRFARTGYQKENKKKKIRKVNKQNYLRGRV